MPSEELKQWRCDACGDAENTDMHCIFKCIAGDPTGCPISCDEAEWYPYTRTDDALVEERDRLRKALKNYGYHYDGCPSQIPIGTFKQNSHFTAKREDMDIEKLPDGGEVLKAKCTCGLQQAISGEQG